jgi:hypothetical protein
VLTSAISVVERRTEYRATGATAPYEAGWASEAIFFIQAAQGHPALRCTAELSPDGIHWVSSGDEPVILEPHAEVGALRLSQFGTWIRIRIEGPSESAPVRLLVHLALKG